ncbi:hypothetical protein AMELA_G00272510 [Ameiurus melas]|uniref:Uncharacterized protein n=1 Tax=Ameiurus melas TaxID=219545 RepID=A0A7J5ZL29_AMEME|nr:hypothetical protein AMELA_G00272510 [Ameiurus melas]
MRGARSPTCTLSWRRRRRAGLERFRKRWRSEKKRERTPSSPGGLVAAAGGFRFPKKKKQSPPNTLPHRPERLRVSRTVTCGLT